MMITFQLYKVEDHLDQVFHLLTQAVFSTHPVNAQLHIQHHHVDNHSIVLLLFTVTVCINSLTKTVVSFSNPAVPCTTDGDIQLLNSTLLLQVCRNKTWHTVCRNAFGSCSNAKVACRQLGYTGLIGTYRY